MPLYELVFRMYETPDPHRAQLGDVIVVVPYNSRNWGKMDLICYTMIPFYSNDDLETMHKFSLPFYEGGNEFLIDPIDPGIVYKIMHKKRYRFPIDVVTLGWMSDFDLMKARSPLIYQPFKKKSDIESMADKFGIPIDCSSVNASDETEVVVDMTESVAILWDKFLESYKYVKKKRL